MPNYTTNLNLEKPLQSEQYNINVFNTNADKIDQFAGQTPPYALTADKLTSGAKINGVNFKGDTDIVTGAGFYYDNVTYGAGDLAFIYNQDGALQLHKSTQDGNIGHNPLTTTGYWEKQDLGGSGGRNVGEIISSSLPLTDAGLHLLDGTRLSGDGIYKEFVDYIAGLDLTANYFCTEQEWQASVTQYGVCGKFVYDSVNNTVRLPKITGIIEGTTDVTALGDLVQAGLPNITGTTIVRATSHDGNTNPASNAFAEDGSFAKLNGKDVKTITVYGGTFNASRSSSIYGNSSTVQPQTIKAFYYIVVATSTKTDIQVDIDEVTTDLNGKVNTSDLAEFYPVIETYHNGTSWYRVYSDGWCEQGGKYLGSGNNYDVSIAFLKNMTVDSTNITVGTLVDAVDTNTIGGIYYSQITSSGFKFRIYGAHCLGFYWQAGGYIEV